MKITYYLTSRFGFVGVSSSMSILKNKNITFKLTRIKLNKVKSFRSTLLEIFHSFELKHLYKMTITLIYYFVIIYLIQYTDNYKY